MWSNGVGQNKERDEKHNENYVEEGFQLAGIIFDRDDEGIREVLGVGNCIINIWDGSELRLAWSKKSSSYFENNFPIFLLSGISNTLICKVCDVLHWVNFLLMKTFSNIFRSTFCWGRRYLNIFYILFIFYYCWQVIFTLRVPSLLLPLNAISVEIVDTEGSFQFSLKLNSNNSYMFTSPLQQILKQKHLASHNCYSVKTCWNS